MPLYTLRHGRTDWNVQRRLQGRTDIPLNEDGRRSAVEARDRFKDIPFDVCYCSPLQRARDTAALLLEGRTVPVVTDDRLTEMGFGVIEGKVPESPEDLLFKDPPRYAPPEGGESFEALLARTRSFLDTVALPRVNRGESVLIVAHGALNCALSANIKGTPIERFWDGLTDNCVLTRLL